MKYPVQTPVRLLSLAQLREKGIPFGKEHLRRMWNRGEFPKPIYLSERKYAWDESVIDAWIFERARSA